MDFPSFLNPEGIPFSPSWSFSQLLFMTLDGRLTRFDPFDLVLIYPSFKTSTASKGDESDSVPPSWMVVEIRGDDYTINFMSTKNFTSTRSMLISQRG